MNREILFRGKLFDGVWIYGDLLIYADTAQIWYEEEGYGKVNELVDLSTVGQYTGLCDKNGRKIFEGDIVVWDYDKVDFDGATHSTPELVRWDKDYCGFIVNYDDMGTIDKNCRVIGNVFDNPELLEKKDETQI